MSTLPASSPIIPYQGSHPDISQRWPSTTCFMGIDTYINIYINIYEYIFLSFLHPEVAWLYGRHVFILYTDLHAELGSLGEKKNAFVFPSRDICWLRRWRFFCNVTNPWRRGGNVCVLLNLFLRNCTFYCKRNKKDYLNICHIKKQSLSNTCDIPIKKKKKKMALQ